VLVNLLSNAVKFTDTGAVTLTVGVAEETAASADPARVRLAVRDSGIGIERTRLERLFEPFVQADASVSRRFGGTGLGLAISKRLVELMDGRLWAESEPGVGSTFSVEVSWPVAAAGVATSESAEARSFDHAAAAVADADRLSSGAGGTRSAASGAGEASASESGGASAPEAEASRERPLRILVAEDNPVNQRVAVRMLKRLGYDCDVVSDGRLALAAVEGERYDVVFMDVQMPELDGLEVTRRVRQSGREGPWIVAMTAHALEEDRRQCLDAGMDAYLSKPIQLAELSLALSRVPPVSADAA
jgi:CheY-like chemotaxis protein